MARLLAAPLLAILVLCSSATRSSGEEPAAPAKPSGESKAAALHDAMRKLWVDHVTWTRTLVIGALADLPDQNAALKRLLRNQVDIGDAIKPYYGDQAGAKLSHLLKEHITIAVDLVGAMKAVDSAKAEEIKTRWTANADEIATFLNKANSTSWPLDSAKSMMREHLDLLAQEVKARIDKDWEADVAAFDRVLEQALHMADLLCVGIQTQFPAMFQDPPADVSVRAP